MVKGAGFLLFALFIDGLQAMISLALFGVISGVSLIPVIGTAIGATAGPIGLALGMAVDVCLSITMGGGLIAALAFNGMLYPSKMIPALAEVIPGINNGPVWTIVVLRCMMQKYQDEHGHSLFGKKRAVHIQEQASPQSGRAAGAVSGSRAPARRAPAAPVAQKQEGRVPGTLKNMDGIRKPSNDNTPLQRPAYVQKAA